MLLFCASDIGGANELLPVMEEAKRRGMDISVYCSTVTAPLFARARISADKRSVRSREEAMKILRALQPSAIILGTTGIPKSEYAFIKAAGALGIRTISVLDEWYNYALRFRDGKRMGLTCLPDIVCVQDTLSKKLAMEEGLPGDRLHITGSPALAALAQRARLYRTSPPARPKELRGTMKRKVLLFLSERLREAYGEGPGSAGTHGPFIGFHQNIVRNDIAEMCSVFPNQILVLEKLHPTEPAKKSPLVAKNGTWHTIVGEVSVEPFLWYADIIVGMCSKTVLEAAVLGRSPLSYQPNAVHPERCTAVRLKLAELHTTKKTLADRLPSLLKNNVHSAPVSLPCADSKAVQRILLLANTTNGEFSA